LSLCKAFAILGSNHISHLIYLQECYDLGDFCNSFKTHFNHSLWHFDGFFNANEIFLTIVLVHHWFLNLCALLGQIDAASFDIINDEALLFIQSFNLIPDEPQL
jgi:hypothetical protein